VGGKGKHRLPLRAFTIVELLIVIAVIIMLMGILIVAINAATRTAQGANTRSLMSSIKQALVRFKADIGYYPPVLGDPTPQVFDPPGEHDLRKLFDPRGEFPWEWGDGDDVVPEDSDGNPNDVYVERIQEWHSVTSLAEYLLGYGNHNQDGYGVIDPTNPNDTYAQEQPPVAIRDPGRDGVWGATIHGDADGSLWARMRGDDPRVDTGKVYGPYLDLKDERMLAAVSAGEPYDSQGKLRLSFPGGGDFDPDNPKVIVDYWGNPIRYYRRLYSPGDLRSPYRRMNRTPPLLPEATLSDVFVLRPFEVDPGAAIDVPGESPDDRSDADGDTTTTIALNSAEFALFSAGADRNFDETVRYDAEGYNQDNIVELGP
jgi:type II secretory pathway pseudopilin PulG